MKDGFGREIDYLRLSVTDLCNLRCMYCMPAEGVAKLRHEDILSVEEITGVARAAASLGISKIRLTGGEPLVRKGIEGIVRNVAAVPGVAEVAMTTNGSLLADFVPALKAAGLTRVNVNINSTDAEVYRQITRGGDLSAALAGVHAALDAGLAPVKLNVVLIGGLNEGQIGPLVERTREADIDVRFIELMPIGACAGWNRERFVQVSRVLEAAPELRYLRSDGVSEVYALPGARGKVGLIRPVSHAFCGSCNRIRVTSDGKLKPCLHSAEEIPLKGLEGDALVDAMRRGILGKPQRHRLNQEERSASLRGMNAIGG
ncbi:MAG: GTP 3',8-cyclase MoaA [Clostridiales Family XIII bacterium]|jgi:cyclic pyranopterin phosphate synthase|nr:GTP 3',8-cyclase MoaA [Clostridiales Family XIII bacterium]